MKPTNVNNNQGSLTQKQNHYNTKEKGFNEIKLKTSGTNNNKKEKYLKKQKQEKSH